MNIDIYPVQTATARCALAVSDDSPIITPAGRWIGETAARADICAAINGNAGIARRLARTAAGEYIRIAAGMNGYGFARDSARADRDALARNGYIAHHAYAHDYGRPVANAVDVIAGIFIKHGAPQSYALESARVVIRNALNLAAANAHIDAVQHDVSGEGTAWRVYACKPTRSGTAQYRISAPGIDGMKSLGAWIAEECGGRYVHRIRGYRIGPRGLAKFRDRYRAAVIAHDARTIAA